MPQYFRMDNALILPYRGQLPRIGEKVLLSSGSYVIGDLEIGAHSSIWFNTVVRADVHVIRIGHHTNIQDNSVVHVTTGVAPVLIGNHVTIGHNAIVHGCTIEDHALIGMGAIIMDRALIRSQSLVAAGAVVTPGKEFPLRSLIKGNPAIVARALSEEEIAQIQESADHYCETAENYFALAEKITQA